MQAGFSGTGKIVPSWEESG